MVSLNENIADNVLNTTTNSTCKEDVFELLMGTLETGTYDIIPAVDVYLAAKEFIDNFHMEQHIQHLERFCRYLNWSLEQENSLYNYAAAGFRKEYVHSWIEHIKSLVVICFKSAMTLKPELLSDSKTLSVLLTVIVRLTTIHNWSITKVEGYKNLEKGIRNLAQNVFSHMLSNVDFFQSLNILLQAGYVRPGKIAFTKTNLHALNIIASRPILESDFVTIKWLRQYITQIFAIPGYIHFVYSMCPDSMDQSLFPTIVNFLDENGMEQCFATKDICYVVALMANLADFGQHYSDLKGILPKLLPILVALSKYCEIELGSSKKSHWHPLLGWVSAPIPVAYLHTIEIVRTQLESLWKPVYIQAGFYDLFEYVNSLPKSDEDISLASNIVPFSGNLSSKQTSSLKNGFVKFFKRVFPGDSKHRPIIPILGPSLNTEITESISEACSLYNNLLGAIPSCRVYILTGLCFKDNSSLLPSLWKYLQGFNYDQSLKVWVELLLMSPADLQEGILLLFCESLAHFLTMLDDQELYEDQKVFKLRNLADIGYFINNLCFRLLSNSNFSKIRLHTWSTLKNFLLILYRRDCRRSFCPEGHWLVESSKMNQLINDVEKGRKAGKKVLFEMPHLIKEEARVIFFRKWANNEKTQCSCFNSSPADDISMLISASTSVSNAPSSLITIHRSRIVEDGYAQLSNLTTRQLKGTVRVRFQNELGLDEAGIDQDGVFKEFLEESIAKVFSPSLNLFKATSENLLYPSPLSYLHENHLDLFEFVGKLLGKSIFEGMVVDVHFAPFFITQMLGAQQNGVFVSVIDELQSFDRELYSSLIYIKHYDGDVRDLELTFSVDQEVFGQVQNVELVPGGRTITVSNENKISYIYLKAHYHLYAQIKEQTNAFLKGFRSVIPIDWLRIFSPPELQRLISGEVSDIDLSDLRRNTQYYGGFHDNHRVIAWLWDILENEFTEQERRLFLKFVTSCSKPPLLGFNNLDPPFSVRCVEVSDDDDTGDTLGSVLRGFLTLGRQEPAGRLPTSSTCFNLLKLPNYHKKATLREKLRYAITSNVGFELS